MNACPTRITIDGAEVVVALTFCRASAPGLAAEDVSSTGAPLNSAASEVPDTPPTTPNALGAELRLDVAVALVTGAAAGLPSVLDETSAREGTVPTLSDIEESSVHPERAQATRTSKGVAFISDSVEVSMETPAESAVAQLEL
jgi:hypothetical protein